MNQKNLPSIPIKEWIVLGIGVCLFCASEIILFYSGFTLLWLNSIASLILATLINFTVFRVENKFKKILSLVNAIKILLLSIHRFVFWAIADFFEIIPNWIKRIVDLLKSFPEFLGIGFSLLVVVLGILALNAIFAPILLIYLTIYGLIISLSAGISKTILLHYDAFGHRMIKPVEKYLNIAAIVSLGLAVIVGAVVLLVLQSFTTVSSVTSADASMAASGNGLSGMNTIISYLPLMGLVVGIVILITGIKLLTMGFAAF